MQVMVIVAMAIVMTVLLSQGSLDSAKLIAYITAFQKFITETIQSLSTVHPRYYSGGS